MQKKLSASPKCSVPKHNYFAAARAGKMDDNNNNIHQLRLQTRLKMSNACAGTSIGNDEVVRIVVVDVHSVYRVPKVW